MSQSGNLSAYKITLDNHSFDFVRFYYGEKTGKRFKAMAFDDFESIEADLHEEKLQQENIDYLRVDL